VKVRRLTRERRDRDGTAFLISSHNLLEMERLADRVAILKAGRVLCEEALDALVRRAGARYRFDVSDPGRARAAIGEALAPPAEAAAVNGTVEVRAGRAEVPALVERLVRAGVAIYEVREVVPTLEDVFREIARDSKEKKL